MRASETSALGSVVLATLKLSASALPEARMPAPTSARSSRPPSWTPTTSSLPPHRGDTDPPKAHPGKVEHARGVSSQGSAWSVSRALARRPAAQRKNRHHQPLLKDRLKPRRVSGRRCSNFRKLSGISASGCLKTRIQNLSETGAGKKPHGRVSAIIRKHAPSIFLSRALLLWLPERKGTHW